MRLSYARLRNADREKNLPVSARDGDLDEEVDADFENAEGATPDTANLVGLLRNITLIKARAPALRNSPELVSTPKSKSKDISQISDTSYRKPENLIATGSIGGVYKYGDRFLMKDYSGTLNPTHTGSLKKANNNANAFKRLYGPEAATVIIHATADPFVKTVSVKMLRVAGESLESLLKTAKPEVLDDILKIYKNDNVIDGLVERLRVNGIGHNDINLANIMYDPKTKKFNLIDFDDVNLNAVGMPLKDGKVSTMKGKLEHIFNKFERARQAATKVEPARAKLASVPLTDMDRQFAEQALAELKKLPLKNAGGLSVNEMINRPKEKCADLMRPVSEYMKEHYTGIRYRGMGIWDKATDDVQMNHFVVLGDRGGKTYVFDLSAGQFADKGMRGLDGPLITTEENWVNIYQNSNSIKLIKYKDFETSIEAEHTFGKYTILDPFNYIDGATRLTSPRWYLKLSEVDPG